MADKLIKNVRLSDDETKVVILDQEKLPNVEEYLELDSAEDIYEAIFRLKVRGCSCDWHLCGIWDLCAGKTD